MFRWIAARPTPDDGCPKGDPDRLGGNGDCHDACSTFAERDAVEAAVAAEREACAKICDEVSRISGQFSKPSAHEAAARIRSRASTPAAIDGLAPGGRDGTEG